MTHKLYKTKEDIEKWLNQYNIKNYKLIEDEEYGYVVNVRNGVYLTGSNLKEIKVKFNIINGFFECAFNELKTLYGCPSLVNGNFDCSFNNLNSLEYCPEIIEKDFWCMKNKIKSLKGCPKLIQGGLNCSYNKLMNLEFCPIKINKNFTCSNNKLNSLEYIPEKVNGDCYFDSNPKLKEIQKIKDFNELKTIHDSIILNKKLEQEINIDNYIKKVKVKL